MIGLVEKVRQSVAPENNYRQMVVSAKCHIGKVVFGKVSCSQYGASLEGYFFQFWCNSYLMLFGVGVSCCILYSIVSYLRINYLHLGRESSFVCYCLLVIILFLFGEVSSSSWCLGWAALFYRGSPRDFHIIILYCLFCFIQYEPRCEKTGLRDFLPGPTQTGLYNQGRWIEALNFGFTKQRDCIIRVAKTKALISCAVTAQLICVFVFT